MTTPGAEWESPTDSGFDVDQPFWCFACCSLLFCPLTSQPTFIFCGRPLALEDHTQPVFLFCLLAKGQSGKFSFRMPGLALPLGFQISSLSHSQVLFSASALLLTKLGGMRLLLDHYVPDFFFFFQVGEKRLCQSVSRLIPFPET